MRAVTVATQTVLLASVVVVARLCWRVVAADLRRFFVVQVRRGAARHHRHVSAVEQTRMLREYRT